MNRVDGRALDSNERTRLPESATPPDSGGDRADLSRQVLRIPRITIEAFCESHEVGTAIGCAAQDRMMSRARVIVRSGGIEAASENYRERPTPNLIVIEARSPNSMFLANLESLAQVCDPGTKVLAIGHVNDIRFYRDLIRSGVSEYLLAPIDPLSLIHGISSIYGEAATSKLGQTIAFVGAKGGVGSSTIAHNVGWELGRQLGSDVILADMDLPFGTASLNFNLDSGMGVADAIRDAGRLDEVLLDRLLVKCGEHLSLLRAPVSLEQCYDLEPNAVAPLIDVAQESAPFMILDMPHVWSMWARDALAAADHIIITAMPDLANLRNAKSLIAYFRKVRPNDPPPRLVLNQVAIPKRPEISPKEFTKAAEVEALACIPFDSHLFGQAANKGQMLADVSSKSVAVKMISHIAETISARSGSKGLRNTKFHLASLFAKKSRIQRS